MSRIGKQPIEIPDGVDVDVKPSEVTVKGPKGELSQEIVRDIKVSLDDGAIKVERSIDRGEHRALHGLTRSLIANMVEGVTDGYERRLEIQGVGYRAQLKGKALEMSLGYSHPVTLQAPEGIEFESRADPGDRARHRQAARRRDRRPHPQEPSAGALQGQGRALRRRARQPQGWQEGIVAVLTKPQKRLRRRRRVRAKIRGSAERPRLRSIAPTAASRPS